MEIKISGYPNQQFYYEVHGNNEGIPILILHGWNGSSATWQDFLLNNKNIGFKWIIADLPGFGNSPAPIQPWTVDDYTTWSKNFYDALPSNIKPQYLLTHSFGGRIAAKWLSTKNHPFKKAILTAAAGLPQKQNLKQVIGKILSRFQAIIPQKLQNFSRKLLYKLLRISDYPLSPVMQATFKNVVREDLSAYFTKINIPIRLVWGDNDSYTPLYMAQQLQKLIPQNELTVLPNVKHGIHRQAPQELANICNEFFKH